MSDETRLLLDCAEGSYEHFRHRLRIESVDVTWSKEIGGIDSTFLYLAFADGKPSQDELVKCLTDKVVQFAVPEAIRLEHVARWEQTQEYRHWQELIAMARESFVSAVASRETTGEPAELLLFVLLEWLLEARQIACKFNLKTSTNVPVHGSDSVHARKVDDILEVYWGESKLEQALSSAIRNAVESLESFLKKGKHGKCPKDHEILILKNHLNLPEEQRHLLLDFFDPYKGAYNKRREYLACLVGFTWKEYEKILKLPPEQAETTFRERYRKQVLSACKSLDKRLLASEILKHWKFKFFLLPFPSVASFRKQFLASLGV